jgi:hypothetical protein
MEGICPAGRAHCAWGGHFVEGIPFVQPTICGSPPFGRDLLSSDQREDQYRSLTTTRYKSHEVTAPTRSGPVRQDNLRKRLENKLCPLR